MLHLGDKFILGGEFNARHTDWGARLSTAKGREFRKAIREENCDFHTSGYPIYWPTDRGKIPDLLDFLYPKKYRRIIYLQKKTLISTPTTHQLF